MDTYVHCMDDRKRSEMDKMSDLYDMAFEMPVEDASYPILCTPGEDGPVRSGFSQPANHRPHDGCRSTGDERETPQSPAAVQIPSRPHQTGTNRGASHRVPAAHPGGIK